MNQNNTTQLTNQNFELDKKCKDLFHKNWDILLTIAIVIVAFFGMFGTDILLFKNTYFTSYSGDFSVSYMGSVFYRLDEWRWPIFIHQNLAYPYGISIHGTDGSPLLSLIFKVLYKFFGVSPEAQFVGIWTLISYILQAYVSVLIFRHAFKNKALIVIGALFFVSSPIMLHRVFVHINLMPHFVLLFAILLWMNNCLGRKEWIYMAILFSLGFLTCPYFLPMQAGFFAALIYKKYYVEKQISLTTLFKGVSFLALVSLFWFYMLGMMTTGQKLDSGGWRGFGMDLSSLICPTWGVPRFFICHLPSDEFSFDYDNYLGLGVVILFCGLFFHVKDLFRRENLKKHWFIALLLLGFFLFAVSPQIRYMKTVLLDYNPGKYISWLGDTFRYSGRFFWPIWYLLVFFLVKTAGNILHKKATYVLFTVLMVQIWDISPLYVDKINFFRDNNRPDGFEYLISPVWEKLAQKYPNVFVFNFKEHEMAWHWAIKYHKNANYGFLNRPTPKAKQMVDKVRQQILSGYISPDFKDYFFVLDSQLLEQIDALAKIDPHVKKLKKKIQVVDGVHILEYDTVLLHEIPKFEKQFIPVNHKFWADDLVQESPNRIYRNLSEEERDYATILEKNNTHLILLWDSWGREDFQKREDGRYYYVEKQGDRS